MTTIQLNEDIKTAMRAKDAKRLSTLRILKAAITSLEGKKNTPLTDADLLATVRGEVKKRQDTLAAILGANRPELETEAHDEIAVLKNYLPTEIPTEDLKKIIIDAIFETGALTQKDMGKVMKVVNDKIKGAADGKTVSDLVRSLLNK